MRLQRKWGQERRDQARRLFEAGAALRVIAREIAVPAGTVHSWAKTEGWQRDATPVAATPAAPPARPRRVGPRQRQQAFDRTWDLVLRQHGRVLALPCATPVELARFEAEMRRLMLLVGLLTKLAPLLPPLTPRPAKEGRPDVSHPADHGALLEEIARRFDAFAAAEQDGGVPEHARAGPAPGLS